LEKQYLYLTIILLICISSSCSLTKRLEPGQLLYTGADISMTSTEKVSNKKQLKTELLELSRPQPNNNFKLRIHNAFKPGKKEKGLRHWLRYKLGEPPVLFQEKAIERSRLVMEKYLHDEGYFNAQVEWDTTAKKQKVAASYKIRLTEQVKINEVFFTLPPRSHLDSLVLEHKEESFIKTNRPYQAEALRLERERLSARARQNGYFRVNANDIYFYVDTSVGENRANVYVRWLDEAPDRLLRYRHGGITVLPTFSLDAGANSSPRDTTHYKGLTIIQRYPFLKPKALRRFIHDGGPEYYDGEKIKSDLTYLQDIGVFKFVNVTYDTNPLDTNKRLNITYQLTPKLTQQVRLDLDANTRTGNFLGTSISGNYTNLNVFGGAENLDLSLGAGLETQLGDTSSLVNTIELSASVSLSLPFLLVPFIKPSPYRQYVARTRFSLSNRFQNRDNFFSINSTEISVTYDWRSGPRLWHQLTPFSASQISVFELSESFQEELSLSPRLAASFEDILIWSGKYKLQYSSYLGSKPRPHYSGLLELESAGNLLYGLTSPGSGGEDRQVFGVPFSQFVRANIDFRYYHQWSKEQVWAFRFNTGLAIPYLNSSTVPYPRQFFVGGANSIRAFRLRQLGPGTYLNTDATTSNFFDQTGDIKIELNAEYRFDLASYFEGALFVDAGNIWLLDQTIGDEQAGKFNFKTFAKEIAVGTGIGLRIDLTYFVIRLDTAWPLRQAVPNQGFQWTVKDWDFGSRDWRKENIVWHLAIGYPF